MPTKTSRKTAARKVAGRTTVRKTSAVRAARPRVAIDTVKVARFGSTPVSVQVNRGSAVRDVLDKAGIGLSSTDKVYINSQRVQPNQAVFNGDILSVISPKAAGASSH